MAARYSYLSLESKDVLGGRMWEVTAGINWYLYPNLRLMLNYVRYDVRDRFVSSPDRRVSGSGDVIQSRFQLDF